MSIKSDNEKKGAFVERIFNDNIEGEYDDEGFFTTPNGSFWDPDGVYFNREGYDKRGGYYDDNEEYCPGKGWVEEKNCYEDEIPDEYASDHDLEEEKIELIFRDIDKDKILDEENLIISKIVDHLDGIENVDENEEEEEEEEKNNLEKKDNEKIKCSLNKHKELISISYCYDCKIYMCKQCEKCHSELFENHHKYRMDKITKDIFTGICKEKNHFNKLSYYCENHNQLCCAACIAKIKGMGNGKHKDCNVCFIKKIKNIKKNKLNENIKYLEDLSKDLIKTINDIKNLSEKINHCKEKIKNEIQIVFTSIRNILNKREDELLLEVNKKYDKLFFNDEFIKEIDKLPNKIKMLLDKGKIKENGWNNKNQLSFLINNCINIENSIEDINKMKDSIKNYNSIKDYELKFSSSEINKLLENIKCFGDINKD